MNRSDEAPDFAEPMEAWRAWRVVRREGLLLLGSVIQKVTWPSGRGLEATCLRRPTLLRRLRRREEHEAPHDRCECGIYATSIDQVGYYLTETPPTNDGRVFGLVSLWDTVVECERGYRAARAYPTRIYVPLDAGPRAADGWAGDRLRTAALRRPDRAGIGPLQGGRRRHRRATRGVSR